MSKGLRACLSICGLLLVSAPAQAQGFLSVEAGASSSGLVKTTAITMQGQLGFFTAGLIGVEGDYSFASETRGGVNGDNIRTIMADILVGPAFGNGRSRAYGAVGVGLIGAVATFSDVFQVSDTKAQNDFGLNVGGGFIGSISRRVGFRVDARYFRDLEKPDHGPAGYFIRFGGGVLLRF